MLRKRTGKYIKCLICNKEFYVKPFLFNKKKFCSKKCYTQYLKENPLKYWQGKHRSKKDKEKMSKARLNSSKVPRKEEHWNWKGGISTYERKLYRNRQRRIKRINAKGSHTFGEWELLRRQYNYTCPACRKKEPEIILTEDHIIPLDKGGSDYIENIQPLCRSCNAKKHTKIIKY